MSWRQLNQVRGPAQRRPWLVSVAAYDVRPLRRKRRRRAEVELPIDPVTEPGGTDPDTGVAAVDLRAALSRLDPDDAALLAMR